MYHCFLNGKTTSAVNLAEGAGPLVAPICPTRDCDGPAALLFYQKAVVWHAEGRRKIFLPCLVEFRRNGEIPPVQVHNTIPINRINQARECSFSTGLCTEL